MRSEPGGVRGAAADAAEDRAAARHQSQRPGEVEGAVLGRRDANDRGAGDDLRGGPGLFGPARGESVRQFASVSDVACKHFGETLVFPSRNWRRSLT